MGVYALVTERDKCAADALRVLREVQTDIENGDAIAVYGIVETKDGRYRQFGSASMSRLQTAGALLECAVERLK